jgi:hypothetical protein
MLHKRAQAKLDSATLASVTKEMAEPRMSRSARVAKVNPAKSSDRRSAPTQTRPRRETS